MLTIDQDEGLTTFCERLLEAAQESVADLATTPLYAVGMEMPSMRGLYAPALDATFEPQIRAAGKWHGRGIAILIDPHQIYSQRYAAAQSAGIADRAGADALARMHMAGVVFHELAHAIAAGERGEGSPIGGDPETVRK